MSCFTPSFRNKGPVSLAQLSAAPALHALVLCIPVLHCALREIGSGSACHQREPKELGIRCFDRLCHSASTGKEPEPLRAAPNTY